MNKGSFHLSNKRVPKDLPGKKRICVRDITSAEYEIIFARSPVLPSRQSRKGLSLLWSNLVYDFTCFYRSLIQGEKASASGLAMLFVLMTAFMIRGMFFTGYSFSDDFEYAHYAGDILDGSYNLKALGLKALSRTGDVSYIYGFRYGMLFPIILFAKTIGAHPDIIAGYSLLLNLLQIVFLYLILKKFFGENIALAGAMILALMPHDILYSSTVLPDTVLPAYTTISLYLFICAQDARKRLSKILLYLLTGLFFAAAYYTRLYAVFMLGVFFLLMFYRKKFDPWVIFVGIGFLLPFFIINFYMYTKTGVWWLRLKAVSNAESVFRRFFPVKDVFRYTTYFFRQLFETDRFIPFALLALGGAGTMAGLKNKGRFIPLFWFAGLFFIAEFGTARISEYTMIHKLPRFMTMLSAPLAGCAGVLIGKLTSKKALMYSAVFLFLFFVFLSIRFDVPVWGIRP
ncbi:MAG: glycosyltransferase family 39 protein, partial [Spirochaetes bacterium]|nr:glycosyltransferase family 39 protein [Spirochaetota bacterium]